MDRDLQDWTEGGGRRNEKKLDRINKIYKISMRRMGTEKMGTFEPWQK